LSSGLSSVDSRRRVRRRAAGEACGRSNAIGRPRPEKK
jgi:hypothetical protein